VLQVQHGWGFQTWEYSPVYALRSYLFLLPHVVVTSAISSAVGSKVVAFYCARCAQGLLCCFLERRFACSIGERFGWSTGTATLWILAGTAGMCHTSSAFLPSRCAAVCPGPLAAALICALGVAAGSITMMAVLAIWEAWIRNQFGWAIVGAVYTIVIVWPFAVLLYVPLGITALLANQFGLWRVLAWGLGSTAAWAGSSMAVDSLFFGRLVLPAWQIFSYNVLDASGGPELYGVEPWYFYALNAALNFNLAFVLAAVLPALLLCGEIGKRLAARPASSVSCGYGITYLAPLYIWFGFFSSIPHKEERFLCPVYPLICFAAASCLQAVGDGAMISLRRLLDASLVTLLVQATRFVALAVILTVSASRVGALYVHYAAPLQVGAMIAVHSRPATCVLP
jgi:alpha-1,2-mannosyltransferase